MSLRNCIHLMWWTTSYSLKDHVGGTNFSSVKGSFHLPQGLSLITFAAPWCPPHPNRIDQSPRSPLVPEGRWWGVIFKGLFMRAPWRGGNWKRTDHAWRTHYLDSPKTGPGACGAPSSVSGVLSFPSGAPEGDQHTAPIFIPFKLLSFKAPTGWRKNWWAPNTHLWLKKFNSRWRIQNKITFYEKHEKES